MRWILSALNAASKSRTSDPGFSAWISWISSGSQEEDDDGLVELHGGGGAFPPRSWGHGFSSLTCHRRGGPATWGGGHPLDMRAYRRFRTHHGCSSLLRSSVSRPFPPSPPHFCLLCSACPRPLRKRPRLQPCHGLEREAFTETSPASVETRLIESNLRAAAAVTSICFLKMSSGS